MWEVTLYKNTGLDSVNTLSDPAILEQSEHISLPALDILQGEFLSSINVKATRNQVKDIDFLCLEDTSETGGDKFYYSVSGFTSTSLDVQTLHIVMDAWLSLVKRVGGTDPLSGIEILDGMTARHHVKKADDLYGSYTEPDPFLTPSKELSYVGGVIFEETGLTQTGKLHVIESTLDLQAMEKESNSTTYTDNLGAYTVTVPDVIPISGYTLVDSNIGSVEYQTPGTKYFVGDEANIQRGVAKVRALGVEGGILNSVVIPLAFWEEYGSNISSGTINRLRGSEKIITAENIEKEYAEVNNKRVLYGELNRIEMISVPNGTRLSFRPEEITVPGTADEKFLFQMAADVRVQGRPYFGPAYFHGNQMFDIDPITGEKNADLARCIRIGVALPGMEWANAPLVYTGQSGSTLTELNYEMSMSRHVNERNLARTGNIINTVGNVLSAIPGVSSIQGLSSEGTYTDPNTGEKLNEYTFNTAGAIGMGVGFVANMAMAGANAAFTKQQYENQYKYNAMSEILNYVSTSKVVAPELHFPRSESVRDFVGNALCVIQYRPQAEDIRKLDKILSMYGYKNVKPLTKEDFTNRSKFNYVAATGVSFGVSNPGAGKKDSYLPKWLRETAAAQVGAGIRVWHQLPDTSAYTDGTNV